LNCMIDETDKPVKGILLRGPVGTGKSDMMRIISRTMQRGGGSGFLIVNAIRIVKEYNSQTDGGDAVILKYAECGPLCIEEIGLEEPGKHYGKEANVIADILALRYERWRHDPRKYQTHFTTNADNDALEKRYDERTISRTDEMTFTLALGGPDRRATSKHEPKQLVRLFMPPPPEPTPAQQQADKERVLAQAAKLREAVKGMAEKAPTGPPAFVDLDMEPFAAFVKDKSADELHDIRLKVIAENHISVARPYVRVIDAELDRVRDCSVKPGPQGGLVAESPTALAGTPKEDQEGAPKELQEA
jgi:hypothetical protein